MLEKLALVALVLAGGCAGGRSVTRAEGRRRVGLEVAGVGAAAIVAAAVVGLDARALANRARADGCTDDLARCPAPALASASDAYARANLTTVLFGGGLVVGALGLGLAFAPAPAPTSSPASVGRTGWRVAPAVGPQASGLVLTGGF